MEVKAWYDENGDMMVEIPDELITDLGWSLDDELEVAEEDGKLVLSRIEK